MKDQRKHFVITRGSGFFLTFENGYTVSVQWGAGNYCDHYDRSYQENTAPTYLASKVIRSALACDAACGEEGSDTAEIAVIDPDDRFCGPRVGVFEHGNDVEGYCTPARVLEVMNIVAAL